MSSSFADDSRLTPSTRSFHHNHDNRYAADILSGVTDDVFLSSHVDAEQNGGGFSATESVLLEEMHPEEGFALREWRKKNAMTLEEKENKEREIVKQIREEAEEYIRELYRKHLLTVEKKKASNRDKEKLFLIDQEKFRAETSKNYWKAIAELIPREVPALEIRGSKKDQQKKKPSIMVIQGPKPGKPTDLSRMRQILLKLKHNTSSHMIPKSSQPTPETDAKTATSPATAEVNDVAEPTAKS